MDTSDNAARIFLRFLALAQQNARTEREVANYAERSPESTQSIQKQVIFGKM